MKSGIHQFRGQWRMLWFAAAALTLLPLAAAQTLPGGLGGTFPAYTAQFDTNTGEGEILKVGSNGAQTAFVESPNFGQCYAPPFFFPSLAFDSSGNLYVACPGANSILMVNPAGTISTFSQGGLLNAPFGIAFDSSGNLFVANLSGNNIVEISRNQTQSIFTDSTRGPLSGPAGLAFDSKGNLFVCSSNTGAVIEVDPLGNQTVFASSFSGASFIDQLAFDAAGNLYVAAIGTASAIYEITPAGAVSTFAAGQYVLLPVSLAFDNSGNLYVADFGNLNSPANGGYIVRIDSQHNQTLFTTNLTIPEGLAFTRTTSYNFSGFAAPISGPPAVNSGNAGRTFPVKWQLTDSTGAYVTSLSVVTSITYGSVACGSFSTAPSNPITTTASGGSGLHYDSTANQYVYNWAAPNKAGCYDLTVTLSTGQIFMAYFNLK